MAAPAAPVAAKVAVTAGKSKGVRRALTVVVLLAVVLLSAPVVAPTVIVVSLLAAASPGGGGTPGSPEPELGVPVASGEWGMPLAGEYSKGRGFGYFPVKGCAICKPQHRGYDMSTHCGDAVFAAGPGTVIIAGSYFDYGNAVMIDHGDGLQTVYGHMVWGSLKVQRGDQVTAGTQLGSEGTTGASSGCHLHYEVRNYGTRVDPAPFMASLGLPLL